VVSNGFYYVSATYCTSRALKPRTLQGERDFAMDSERTRSNYKTSAYRHTVSSNASRVTLVKTCSSKQNTNRTPDDF
jgi:hypothetical protein